MNVYCAPYIDRYAVCLTCWFDSKVQVFHIFYCLIVFSDGQDQLVGTAFVFSLVGSQWSQSAQLFASDPQPNAIFGTSVSIDANNLIVVTAPDACEYRLLSLFSAIFLAISVLMLSSI